MFNLDLEMVPARAEVLSEAVDRSLRKWILLPGDFVAVHSEGNLPNLQSFAISVSGGKISSAGSIPFELPRGELQPGPCAEAFAIAGNPVWIAGIPMQLQLKANRVAFVYGQSADRKLIASLKDASDGTLEIDIRQADLEAGVLQLARQFAGDTVAIQKINIALTSISPTPVSILLTIAAKKFVTAIIRVTGRISVDDQMVARATDLKATADGMVGGIAVGLLQPQLQKIQGQPLPLLAFPLGNVKLHGVEIRTTNGLQISAGFGSSLS